MSHSATFSGSLTWFARHEARLIWRDWLGMLQGGRRGRERTIILVILIGLAAIHLFAYRVLDPGDETVETKVSLLVLTGSAFLVWTMMLSQALEAVTRAFHTRADLDLILSSPASARAVFAIRMGGVAAMSIGLAVMLAGPFINVMAFRGGPQFLNAYGVLASMGSLACACAVCITVLLFKLVGPKRTRLTAQIVAAVVGAGFVIGVQAVAIWTYGSFSRIAMFQSTEWASQAPSLDSAFWWPARAAMGDAGLMAALLLGSLGILAASMTIAAGGFSANALALAGVSRSTTAQTRRPWAFRGRSVAATLRHKEWLLLRRDPWLLSQSLMQLLYLLPPALMLWRSFGGRAGALAVLAPVLVMAAGQLAGGLAWLAISGEDAPDLVATAPVTRLAMMRAKIEAVMAAVAMPILPFVLVIALVSPWIAGMTAIFTALSAAGATTVQIIFMRQAKRSHFRRRQTSSRLATFAEAFCSISIAAAAGFAAAGSWAALIPLAVAAAVLIGSRAALKQDA